MEPLLFLFATHQALHLAMAAVQQVCKFLFTIQNFFVAVYCVVQDLPHTQGPLFSMQGPAAIGGAREHGNADEKVLFIQPSLGPLHSPVFVKPSHGPFCSILAKKSQ